MRPYDQKRVGGRKTSASARRSEGSRASNLLGRAAVGAETSGRISVAMARLSSEAESETSLSAASQASCTRNCTVAVTITTSARQANQVKRPEFTGES